MNNVTIIIIPAVAAEVKMEGRGRVNLPSMNSCQPIFKQNNK